MGAAAIAVILVTSGSPGPDALHLAGEATSAPERAPGPREPLPPLAPPPAGPDRDGQEPVSTSRSLPEPPAPDAWDAIPLTSRPAALGDMGGAVAEGLAELRERIGACFDEATQSRYGQSPVSRSTHPSSEDAGEGIAMLVLHIDARPGEAVIVDAPVVSQGGASNGLVACAQEVLRGHVIPLPGHTTSGRARFVFPLVP